VGRDLSASTATERTPQGRDHPGLAVSVGSPAVQQSAVERSPVDRAGGYEPGSHEAAARAICLRLLAVAPRPRAGLLRALKRKQIPDDAAEAVLDRLTDIGLIDDAAYAHGFVRAKHRDRALGRSALRQELQRLGLDEDSISGAVQAVDADAECGRATELIDRRVEGAMVVGEVAAKRRLLGLLSRRGYSAEIAVPVVDKAISDYLDGPRTS